MTFKSKSFKIIIGVLIALIAIVIIMIQVGSPDLENYEIVEKEYNDDINQLNLRILVNDPENAEEIAEHVADEYTGMIEIEEGESPKTVNGIFIFVHENDNGEMGRHLGTAKKGLTQKNIAALGVEETFKFYYEK